MREYKYDEEEMMALRLQKLKVEGMIMEYNLDLINFLEKAEDISEHQKEYLSKELSL